MNAGTLSFSQGLAHPAGGVSALERVLGQGLVLVASPRRPLPKHQNHLPSKNLEKNSPQPGNLQS